MIDLINPLTSGFNDEQKKAFENFKKTIGPIVEEPEEILPCSQPSPEQDEILQKFVTSIDNTCRSSDTVARWSTEEFLLVCPDTELSQAIDVANKIRETIQEASWPNDIKITCSSGVAQMYDEDLNDLIARANKALYKAKITGSNRTAAA